MIKYILKIAGILIGADAIVFCAMIITTMTDEKPPFISTIFYWLLENVLGFPLVLINREYPFFLNSKHLPVVAVPLIIINNLILAFLIFWFVKKLLRGK